MTLISKFTSFFTEVTGNAPRQWQVAAMEYVIANGKFPSWVTAPTGAGKGSLPVLHAFAYAMVAEYRSPRMVLVVPLRALVDTGARTTAVLASALDSAEKGTVTREVADSLLARRSHTGFGGTRPTPLVTNARRGGTGKRGLNPEGEWDDAFERSVEWKEDPSACTVLTMTQELFGSALLMRGYRVAARQRVIEASLLAYGTVAVLDEAHRARQLAATVDRVGELSAMTNTLLPPPVYVVRCTATPGIVGATEQVDPLDRAPSALHSDLWESSCSRGGDLFDLFTAKKTLRVIPSDGKALTTAGVAALVMEQYAIARAAKGEHATMGVLCNTVSEALALSNKLRNHSSAPRVVLITGRMRPYERDALARDYPGIYTQNCTSVDIVVATQTIEVGVDINFTAMVTYLAPAAVLAQRAGRVNRSGADTVADLTEFTVIVPSSTLPYTFSVENTLAWLESLNGSINPAALLSSPPALEPLARVSEGFVGALSRVEWHDAMKWAITASVRGYHPTDDVSMFLRDSLETGNNRGGATLTLALREAPRDAQELPALLGKVRVEAVEQWRVTLTDAVGLVQNTAWRKWDDPRAWRGAHAVTVTTGDSVQHYALDKSLPRNFASKLSPWSSVVIWVEHGQGIPVLEQGNFTASGNGDTAFPVPLEALYGAPIILYGLTVGDESQRAANIRLSERPPSVVKESRPDWKSVRAAVSPLDHDHARAPWAVFRSEESLYGLTDEQRQELVLARGVRTDLAGHQEDVAFAAGVIGQRCGLDPAVVEALVTAGAHHDDGKEGALFQQKLYGSPKVGKGLIAKSDKGSGTFNPLARTGWRHEQLSAAMVHAELGDPLVTVLCGLSHGHGRGCWRHGFGTLLRDQGIDDSDVCDLFTDGTWDAMVHHLSQKIGPWGLAYLEALLRAADNSVSGGMMGKK